MTIAPLTPAAAPVPTTGAPAGSSTAGDFLAEIVLALGAAPAQGGPATPASPATPVGQTNAAIPATPGAPATPATPAGVGAPAVPATPATPAAPAAPAAPAPMAGHPASPRGAKRERAGAGVGTPDVDSNSGSEGTPTAPATPTASPAATPAAPTIDPSAQPLVAATAVQQPATPAEKPADRAKVDNPGLHLGVNRTGHPLRPAEVRALAQPDVGPEASPVDPVASAPTAPAAAAPATAAPTGPLTPSDAPAPSTAGLTAPTATAPTTAATPAPAPAPAPATTAMSIPDQLFGAVTNLTSRGNGTHRITMKLQPEALGEVRVVLSLRDGAVHVRLAAGQEARAALLEGSPELRQLLEHAGATETRIVVRELPTGAASPVHQPATQTPTADTATAPMNSGLTDGDRSPDRHAGTRADHLATDGDDNTRGHRTGGRRDVTPIRSAGSTNAVDVTM